MSAPESSTPVKITGPADVVGLVPYLVGFHPAESLVVMCLSGPRLRSGLTMRVDLPPPGEEARLAREVALRAARGGAEQVLLLVYTEADLPSSGTGPVGSLLVDELLDALRQRGVGCTDAVLVRAGRWWSYHCRQPACCPPEGTPVPDRPTGPAVRVAAEAALLGRAPLPDRAALERSVEGPQGLRLEVIEQVYDRVVDEVGEGWAADAEAVRVATLASLREALAAYEQGAGRLEDEVAARAVVALHDRRTRDELTTWVLDAPPEPLLALLLDLARHAPDDMCAPICTVLAWVAHAQGDGGLAGVAVDRALRADPGYVMAGLVSDGLDRQLEPSALRQVSAAVRAELDGVTSRSA